MWACRSLRRHANGGGRCPPRRDAEAGTAGRRKGHACGEGKEAPSRRAGRAGGAGVLSGVRLNGNAPCGSEPTRPPVRRHRVDPARCGGCQCQGHARRLQGWPATEASRRWWCKEGGVASKAAKFVGCGVLACRILRIVPSAWDRRLKTAEGDLVWVLTANGGGIDWRGCRRCQPLGPVHRARNGHSSVVGGRGGCGGSGGDGTATNGAATVPCPRLRRRPRRGP